MSEELIEMLVYEGFGNIVGAPNHEKISALLADRASKIDELNRLKKELEETRSGAAEIETLKLVNEKLTNDMAKLKSLNNNLEEINRENEVILSENISLKSEINKLHRNISSEHDEQLALIEQNHIEIGKLKEDNFQLKMEIDRLYDEIGSFEVENKQLRDEAKRDNFDEVKKLKQEVEDLNEELDELIQYKANYESLKLDFDKLNATVQLNSSSQQELNLKSPSKTSLTSSSSFKTKAANQVQENQDNSKLELEWIRRENEKILLDLEKVQEKLNDKTQSYNELKSQLAIKDEQMNEFINKYEKHQTNKDDVLQLQKKVLDLEHLLTNEKEEKIVELEMNEERQKDLLKRNDSLWSQLTNMEQKYKETMDIVRQQTERIHGLETQLSEYEAKVNELDDLIGHEKELKENLRAHNESLRVKLDETINNLDDSKAKHLKLNQSFTEEAEKTNSQINLLNDKIAELNGVVKELEKVNAALKLEIDGLVKEKTFIIAQNESAHAKVMQDYLMLQEKFTDVSYQLNKLSKENGQMLGLIQEKETHLNMLENEKSQLGLSLKQEGREKLDALDNVKHLDSLNSKVNISFNYKSLISHY